jgi:branched-chain amino acid transport system permease protein
MSGPQAETVRWILAGVALMLIVIFRPQGILGDKREMTFVK